MESTVDVNLTVDVLVVVVKEVSRRIFLTVLIVVLYTVLVRVTYTVCGSTTEVMHLSSISFLFLILLELVVVLALLLVLSVKVPVGSEHELFFVLERWLIVGNTGIDSKVNSSGLPQQVTTGCRIGMCFSSSANAGAFVVFVNFEMGNLFSPDCNSS